MVHPGLSFDEHGCQLSGDLVFGTVNELLSHGESLIRESEQKSLVFNCQGVERVDSAGLTLLLEWLAVARQRDISIRFTQLPNDMLSIARLSNVENLLLSEDKSA